MCGRYSLVTPAEKWAQFFDVNPDCALVDPPRYNIAPGQPVSAVRSAQEPLTTRAREVVKLRWGLVPAWAKDPKIGHRLVNARAESLAEKPAFESALRRRRCLIVADGFYEWSGPGGRRRPHYVHRRDGAPFAIAGLWERWQGPASDAPGTPIETCTVVTTKANGTLFALHDRMPALLDPREYAAWLGRPGQETQPAALAPLLRPCPDDWLLVHEVGMRVNDARFDAPECIAPLGIGALVS